MIFRIFNSTKPKEVVVYETIDQITSGVDWQDILDEGVTHIDEEGRIYAWDDTKKNEYATVFGYTMKVVGMNMELAERCRHTYKAQGKPDEFLLPEQ